jgi:hypothetical protein
VSGPSTSPGRACRTCLALALLVSLGVKLLALAILVVLMSAPAVAQVAPPPAKGDRDAVQHGAQPNPGEVRPGNRQGDAPSAAAGDLVTRAGRRVFGLPVAAALVVAGVIVALVVVAGIVIPGASRRRRARGGGTYGGPDRRPPR